MLTEEKGVVSIWVGVFACEEDLRRFVEDVYDEDGDSSSPFRLALGLDWYDEDQKEASFSGDAEMAASELVVGHSYWESLSSTLATLSVAIGNSVVLLYDYRYLPPAVPVEAVLRFVGSFPYQAPSLR